MLLVFLFVRAVDPTVRTYVRVFMSSPPRSLQLASIGQRTPEVIHTGLDHGAPQPDQRDMIVSELYPEHIKGYEDN